MSEKETELTALEAAEAASAASESIPSPGAAAEDAEVSPAAEVSPIDEAGPADSERLKAECDRLSAECEQLKTERDQLVDRLARLQAEFENARRRGERERLEFRDYATGAVVERFLPVLDNFELALKSSGSGEQLRAGVELILKQMEEILRQLHVSPVPAVGEQFDPRQHEALGTVERDDLPDQHVAEEIRRGYRLRERLLRPALVRVASNSKQTSE
jgi:molecular chaperone GrpE